MTENTTPAEETGISTTPVPLNCSTTRDLLQQSAMWLDHASFAWRADEFESATAAAALANAYATAAQTRIAWDELESARRRAWGL